MWQYLMNQKDLFITKEEEIREKRPKPVLVDSPQPPKDGIVAGQSG